MNDPAWQGKVQLVIAPAKPDKAILRKSCETGLELFLTRFRSGEEFLHNL